MIRTTPATMSRRRAFHALRNLRLCAHALRPWRRLEEVRRARDATAHALRALTSFGCDYTAGELVGAAHVYVKWAQDAVRREQERGAKP